MGYSRSPTDTAAGKAGAGVRSTPPSWERYAAIWANLHGGFDLRRAAPAVRGWLRAGYAVARLMTSLHARPALFSTLALSLAAAVPLVAGHGRPGGLLVGAGLVLAGAFAATVGKALAVIRGRRLRRGQVFDAILERLSETSWLMALWLVGVTAPLIVATGLVTWLLEYLRTQAFLAGMSVLGTQTVADRPARVSLVVAGLSLAGLAGLAGSDLPAGVLTVVVAGWLVLALVGVGQLVSVVRRALR